MLHTCIRRRARPSTLYIYVYMYVCTYKICIYVTYLYTQASKAEHAAWLEHGTLPLERLRMPDRVGAPEEVMFEVRHLYIYI